MIHAISENLVEMLLHESGFGIQFESFCRPIINSTNQLSIDVIPFEYFCVTLYKVMSFQNQNLVFISG